MKSSETITLVDEGSREALCAVSIVFKNEVADEIMDSLKDFIKIAIAEWHDEQVDIMNATERMKKELS